MTWKRSLFICAIAPAIGCGPASEDNDDPPTAPTGIYRLTVETDDGCYGGPSPPPHEAPIVFEDDGLVRLWLPDFGAPPNWSVTVREVEHVDELSFIDVNVRRFPCGRAIGVETRDVFAEIVDAGIIEGYHTLAFDLPGGCAPDHGEPTSSCVARETFTAELVEACEPPCEIRDAFVPGGSGLGGDFECRCQ